MMVMSTVCEYSMFSATSIAKKVMDVVPTALMGSVTTSPVTTASAFVAPRSE